MGNESQNIKEYVATYLMNRGTYKYIDLERKGEKECTIQVPSDIQLTVGTETTLSGNTKPIERVLKKHEIIAFRIKPKEAESKANKPRNQLTLDDFIISDIRIVKKIDRDNYYRSLKSKVITACMNPAFFATPPVVRATDEFAASVVQKDSDRGQEKIND